MTDRGICTQEEIQQYNRLAKSLEHKLSRAVSLLSWHVCELGDPWRIVVVEEWRLSMFRVHASLTINGRLCEVTTPVAREMATDSNFSVIHWLANNIARSIGDWIVEYDERSEEGDTNVCG